MIRFSPSGLQQGLELAPFVKSIEVVAAAYMLSVDEDLRHGGAPMGPLDHFRPGIGLLFDIDLGEGGAFPVEKLLRGRAIGAPALGIDRDGRHACLRMLSLDIGRT